MPNNIYIHIPFCKSKCKYCSFISYLALEKKEQYLDKLAEEIEYYYKGEVVNTIYFGGGTPSLLTIDEFKKILNLFKFTGDAEITTELNPETLTKEYLQGLKNIGINRISLGCQTFDDDILKFIGRRHSSKQVIDAVNFAQQAGLDNISLDFIYGLPNQNINQFKDDLELACSLGIKHISLYGLKIDDDCYFYKNPPQDLPDEDIQADMYLTAIYTLNKAGFEHYEISNFSKPNYFSRHNMNYWDNNFYYGFGIGAHGYIDNIRYNNFENFEDYFKKPAQHQAEIELTKQNQLEEEIFLGFRRIKGIDKNLINQKFSIDFDNKYSKILKKYLDSKHIEATQVGYKLTTQGVLVSNLVLSEFLE